MCNLLQKVKNWTRRAENVILAFEKAGAKLLIKKNGDYSAWLAQSVEHETQKRNGDLGLISGNTHTHKHTLIYILEQRLNKRLYNGQGKKVSKLFSCCNTKH